MNKAYHHEVGASNPIRPLGFVTKRAHASNRRPLLTATVACSGLLLAACTTVTPDAAETDKVVENVVSTLSWKGLNWNLTNGGMAGVAQGSASNISVDSDGFLHLKITKSGSTWTASEMFSTTNLGFGTYQWQISGPVDRLDPSVVLGLFPYGPAAGIGGDGTNELDQEFAFWNEPEGTNFGWTFYPATGSQIGEKPINFSLHGGSAVTSRMVWSSTKVVGSLLTGYPDVGSNAGLIDTFTYQPSNPTTNIPQRALPLGMNLWLFERTPASSATIEVVIRDFQFIPEGSTGPGTGTGTDTNLAPAGTGYIWSKNSSASSNSNRVANAGVNDSNLSTSVLLNVDGEGGAAAWEAAGVAWSSAKTISSAQFVNGSIDTYGNGYFQANVKLQFTTDGTTWSDSGWTISPAYPNSSAAGGKTYTFTGAAKSAVLGARVTGQTGSESWNGSVNETLFIGH